MLFISSFCWVNGQNKDKKWVIGMAIGGDFESSATRYTQYLSTKKNYETTIQLQVGRLIKEKNYFFGLADLSYRYTSQLDEYDSTFDFEYSNSQYTIQPGVGWRGYYQVNEKNIVGFTCQAIVMGGVRISNYTRIRSDNNWTETYKNTKSIVSAEISPGVYINISPKWQLLLGIGKLYYNYVWGSDKGTIFPTGKGPAYGLAFNTGTFRLTATRFF